MIQLSEFECEAVGGAGVPALIGLGIAILKSADAIREFCDGLFDGYGRL